MNNSLFSSSSEEWSTPQDFFDKLNDEFHFTVDVCSTHENAKCEKHYTKDDDGLSQDWTGETVWCNPPYGRQMQKWIRKCAEHGNKGGLAVMLIPARTDTKAFHEFIYGKAEIRFSDCYEVYGMKRTGCCGCPFNPNIADDLQAMYEYEPRLFKACMNVFGQAYELTDKFNCRRKKCLPDFYQLKMDCGEA